MATYIVLGKFTQQGIERVNHTAGRREAARELAKSLGADIKHVYLTLGQYDLVIIAEAPSNEAVAELALRIGMQGNLSSQTLVAFDETTTDNLVRSL